MNTTRLSQFSTRVYGVVLNCYSQLDYRTAQFFSSESNTVQDKPALFARLRAVAIDISVE